MVELARKLTKPDGSQYGLHIEYFETVPYSGGAYYVNDRNAPTRGALDDPRWARSVDLWVDWTTRQKIMPTAADRERLGNANGWALFAQNKVAMFISSGRWHIRNFLQDDPTPVGHVLGAAPDRGWPAEVPHRALRARDDPERAQPRPGLGVAEVRRGKPGYEIGQRHVPPEVVRLRAHVPSNDLEVARLKKLGMTNIEIMVKGAPDVLWWPFHAEGRASTARCWARCAPDCCGARRRRAGPQGAQRAA